MTLPLSNRNRQMLASFLGTSLLIMLLLLASLDVEYKVEPPPKITMREVLMYTPPPLPPPPMGQNASGSAMPSLTRANVENPVRLDFMELEVDMEAVGVSAFGTGGPGGSGSGAGGLGTGGGGEWGTVSFSELDNIPMVRSAGILSYPEEAEGQGILQFEVLLHIIIDEMGRTYPVRIMQNPFPSMNEEIMKYASAVVFTSPTRRGAPVRTEYAWPLLIKKPKTD